MEITLAFGIAVGGVFLSLTLFMLRHHIRQVMEAFLLWTNKHFVYPQRLRRHRYLGPWSRADVLLQSVYFAVIVFCLRYKVSSISKAGLRATNLSLINLVPLLSCPSFNVLADLLGISLSMFRRLHRLAGVMSFVLLVFHVVTAVASRDSFPLHILENLWGVIGGSSLCLLMLSLPLLRALSHEVFIRSHQVLAVFTAYSIWRHLALQPLLPRIYIYIFAVIFLAAFLLQCGLIAWRNKAAGRGCPRASISHVNDMVKIRLSLSRPLEVKVGQHIKLWMPLDFWSFCTLDLFIEPHRGFTQKLLQYSKSNHSPRLALFSGPHSTSAPVGDYETVLMVASGFGIAAQLPYLKQLIYGYNACKTRTRRVHLVWQLETLDIGIAVESLLNDTLADDTLDEGYILSILIYIESGKADPVPFSRRAIVYSSTADLTTILQEEAEGKFITKVQDETGERGGMLVIVSGTGQLRDQLRDTVRGYLDDKVRLWELEYQLA
ncbi:cell surface metalloreductase [Amylocarpus encephaloides]|uniref:Cell surface metalloreductase n=1 Tax=Amylocarpus encephaloides TaxID=45428 RepID=A0A9P7YD74_9HELO|nr:cell surface metalloreductase [Amylocarpus encephaloides]